MSVLLLPRCDVCKSSSDADYTEAEGWDDLNKALNYIREKNASKYGWVREGGKDICPRCNGIRKDKYGVT